VSGAAASCAERAAGSIEPSPIASCGGLLLVLFGDPNVARVGKTRAIPQMSLEEELPLPLGCRRAFRVSALFRIEGDQRESR